MTEMSQSSEPSTSGRTFGAQLPWERLTMWVAIGLLVFVMRDFFFVIFMTFLLCYFVRRIVNFILSWMPEKSRIGWADRSVTIGVFVALRMVVGGLFASIVPKMIEQSRTVFFKIEHAEVQDEFDRLLRRTIGEYEFQKTLGDSTDKRYQDALSQYRAEPHSGRGISSALASWESTVKARFDAAHRDTVPTIGDEQTQFAAFWDGQWKQNPDEIPVDFVTFSVLKEARAKGDAEFSAAMTKVMARLTDAEKQRLDVLD